MLHICRVNISTITTIFLWPLARLLVYKAVYFGYTLCGGIRYEQMCSEDMEVRVKIMLFPHSVGHFRSNSVHIVTKKKWVVAYWLAMLARSQWETCVPSSANKKRPRRGVSAYSYSVYCEYDDAILCLSLTLNWGFIRHQLGSRMFLSLSYQPHSQIGLYGKPFGEKKRHSGTKIRRFAYSI